MYCNETDLITYGIFSNLYVHDSGKLNNIILLI